MPVYEYICKNCNLEEEKKVEVEQRDLVYCPKCKKKMERKLSKDVKVYFKHNIFLDGKAE